MSSHDELLMIRSGKALTILDIRKKLNRKPVKILDAYIFHDPSPSIPVLPSKLCSPNHADAANEGQVGWRLHQLGNSWWGPGVLGMDSSTKMMNQKKKLQKQRWFHQEDNSQASQHVPPRRNRWGTGAKNGRCRLRKTAANGVKGDICVSYRHKGAVNLEQRSREAQRKKSLEVFTPKKAIRNCSNQKCSLKK